MVTPIWRLAFGEMFSELRCQLATEHRPELRIESHLGLRVVEHLEMLENVEALGIPGSGSAFGII